MHTNIAKSTKSTKATFFILDVVMRTKIAGSIRRKVLLPLRCSSYAHKNVVFFICLCAFCAFYAFLPLKCFYARLRLFLFLFAYVRFLLFVLVGSFRERYKTSQALLSLDVLWAQKCSFLFADVRFVFFVPNKQLSFSLMLYARLRLFLFLFAYVLFMFFMLVRFFRERYKTSPIPSFAILL